MNKSVDATVEDEINIFVEKHFDKKFSFNKNGEAWTIPNPSELWVSEKWEENSLLCMKDELNKVKSLLDDKERTEWHNHTRLSNPTGSVVAKLKRQFHPELCTQAWAKFYEILSSYPELTACIKNKETFNSLHLCEAPGAFITALNHFLVSFTTNHYVKSQWNWRGITLNPYYEGNSQSNMISDDRFILQTLDKWCFGVDTTGDIMKIDNLDHFKKEAEALGKIHLITADGSIDCTTDPGEQENTVAWLHYCEVVSALMILAENGNFVIKMFTFYEVMSVTIMYLLNCVFSKVHVFKPGTSKYGNSEVYIICIDFQKHLIHDYIDVLRTSIENRPLEKCLFSCSHIPNTFLNQLKKCSLFFQEKQIAAIHRNIRLFEELPKHEQEMNNIKDSCVTYYINKYKVTYISPRCLIVPVKKSQARKDFICHFQQGSFSDCKEMSKLPLIQKLKYFENELDSLLPEYWKPTQIVRLLKKSGSSGWEYNPLMKMNIIWGKSFNKVCSSRFCYQYLMNLWLDVTSDPEFIDSSSEWIIEDEDHKILTEWRKSSRNSCLFQITKLDNIFKEDLVSFEKIDVEVELLESLSKSKDLLGEVDYDNIFKMLKENHKIVYEYLLWIQCILLISKKYNSNCSLFISTGDILTRFTAGCLFILTCMFRKVELVRPTSAPSSNPVTWIFCTGSDALPEETVMKLNRLKMEIIQQIEHNYAVMEILPITLLTEDSFHSWLYSFNEKKMAQRLHNLLNDLKSNKR